MQTQNPSQPPRALLEHHQADEVSVLPRAAAVLAFLFALALAMLVAYDTVTDQFRDDGLGQYLLHNQSGRLFDLVAGVAVGIGLWKGNAWAWRVGAIGAGYRLVELVMYLTYTTSPHVSANAGLLYFLLFAFLVILLQPRTIHGCAPRR
jgi:hypothetical protein